MQMSQVDLASRAGSPWAEGAQGSSERKKEAANGFMLCVLLHIRLFLLLLKKLLTQPVFANSKVLKVTIPWAENNIPKYHY